MRGAGPGAAPTWADEALAAARPEVLWFEHPDPGPRPALDGDLEVDLAIVGGGFTGLWAALMAAEDDPGRRIVVVEADRVAAGASGRNGGFVDASLTHGLENGLARWPDEIDTLVRLGRENLAGLRAALGRHRIEADLEMTGEIDLATEPHHLEWLDESAELYRRHGEDVVLLDGNAMRAEVDSPCFLGGLWRRDQVGLVDPVRLARGLADAVERLGVTVLERSPVVAIDDEGGRPVLRGERGRITTDRVVVATNAYRRPWRRSRLWVVPVYDYVLATEPLDAARLGSVGWRNRQGLGEVTNQFHYFRLTPDDRILWGGYDAIYPFGGRIDPRREQSGPTHRRLAHQFFETFPQLEGVRFTHRWAGPIATTTRFTALWRTARGGRLVYAGGYTGLGVGASRFGARVALDLVDGLDTERTALTMVRRAPVPFPPEPVRWIGVQLTRRALQRADRRQGRRGPWLALLDRLGIGFDS